MKTYEIIIYDFNANDEVVEYDRIMVRTEDAGEMMMLAEDKCQEIMQKHDLDDIYWNYAIKEE